MEVESAGLLLSIYLNEADKWRHQPLYVALVDRAKQDGLAGATVLRGLVGFGAHGRVHSANILDLSTDLPVVVQIIDRRLRVEAFLPVVDEMVAEGLVTLTDVRLHFYRHR